MTATEVAIPVKGVAANIVSQRHPRYDRWAEDEQRQRATYLATRRALAPFLVAHRFEGATPPAKLRRAQFGYGVRLNHAYVTGLAGHVRGAAVDYEPGPLKGPDWGKLESDATGTGCSWGEFFGQTVLEWMLTSPGGLVVVDTTRKPGDSPATKEDEAKAKLRPILRWVPFGNVHDCGRSDTGFRWVVLREMTDTREPGDGSGQQAPGAVLYRLDEATGICTVTHYKANGDVLGTPVEMEPLYDVEGRPQLPMVLARFGQHPEVDFLGSGLLQGLDDIVVDLYNLLTEVREAYRDTAFGLMVYRGEDHETVQKQLEDGSRFVALGIGEHVGLERLAAESSEVDAGMRLVELALRAWSESAAQQAADAQTSSSARSGMSLLAEFQLDQRPLLVQIAEALDDVEVNVLFLVAQLWGRTPEAAQAVEVERDKQFRQENEESRIARIVKEFLEVLPLPAEVIRRAIVKWVEASGLVDMDETVPTADGSSTTVGEVVAAQAAAIGEARQTEVESAPAPGGLL